MVIVVVHEQSRITRAGYRISRLAAEEVELAEQVRIDKVRVTRLRQPELIERRVAELRMNLQRPADASLDGFGRFASASSAYAR